MFYRPQNDFSAAAALRPSLSTMERRSTKLFLARFGTGISFSFNMFAALLCRTTRCWVMSETLPSLDGAELRSQCHKMKEVREPGKGLKALVEAISDSSIVPGMRGYIGTFVMLEFRLG